MNRANAFQTKQCDVMRKKSLSNNAHIFAWQLKSQEWTNNVDNKTIVSLSDSFIPFVGNEI